ncbi:MAG: PAS domain S-box protein [Candidatus Manganitrophus sp.]|nr:PAS domain S-box protein [Candidatus Manganitrophus sp.]
MIEQLLDPAYYAYSLFSVPTFLLAVALLFLGTFVWVHERGTRVSFSFFIMALAAGIWLFAFSGMYAATDKKVALLWAKGAYLGVPFIPSAVYSFAVTVLRITERRKIIVWIVSFLSLVFSFFALATDLLISDLHYYPWGYYPKYGALGLPFLAFFFGTMALSLYEFSAEFKKTGPGTHKLRVKSFMVGFGVASLGSIDYFAKYGVPIYPFGYLPIFVFFIIAVQTIRRYRLVDITPAFVADQIIATMADSLIVCDAEGKIRLVNPTACSILGYSRTELLGKPMASFLAAARAHRFGEALQGTTIRDEEAEFHAKGGRRVDVSISVSHLRDQDQSAQGVVIIGRDIRERKRIEEELNFLAKFPAENPNPVLRISKEGMILYANRVAQALLKLWDWKSGEPSPSFFGWRCRRFIGRV